MLVIEIDGDTRVSQQDYDTRRTAFLVSQGYHVVRFTNSDVMTNLEGVVRPLQAVIDIASLPSPLRGRSEEHTSELQSLMRISSAVFCLKKQTNYKYVILKTNSL